MPAGVQRTISGVPAPRWQVYGAALSRTKRWLARAAGIHMTRGRAGSGSHCQRPQAESSEHRLATGFHSPRACEGGWRCDFVPAMPITVAGRVVENCGKFFRGISLRPCNIRVSWGTSGRLRSDSTASTGSCPACGSFFIAPQTQIGPGTTLWRGLASRLAGAGSVARARRRRLAMPPPVPRRWPQNRNNPDFRFSLPILLNW
jgi:hypothetical protein